MKVILCLALSLGLLVVAKAADSLPKELPKWTLSDSAGEVVLPQQKVTVLNFWATWCGPCRAEITYFNYAQRKYSDKVQIYGISLDQDFQKAVTFGKDNIVYSVVKMPEEQVFAFQQAGYLRAIPETFILAADGSVSFHHVGLLPKAMLEQAIEAALAKK